MATVEERGGGCGGDGMHLVWEEVTVVLPSFGNGGGGGTRRLLNGLNGFAVPSRIMAIMGPSGSGKSTLLDALAGRLAGNIVMSGNVFINGKKAKLDYGGFAYVTQEDTLLGTLTVRETLTYSASLRLPSTLTKQEIKTIVEDTIVEVGLQDCADRLIGNWHLRGISGGEKKRLSVAIEILTRPRLLFLDEPTSGLDSASAFFIVQVLRRIALENRTVICSIHQPSSEVFALFDDLFLLSGGEPVFFGEAKLAAQFFAEAGFPCPSRRNPSDHFLRCINADFDEITATLLESRRLHEIQNPVDPITNMPTSEIRSILIKKYRCCKYAATAKTKMREIKSNKELAIEGETGSQATWSKQLWTLTKRSFVNMYRDAGYYWIRIGMYIILSLCVGSIFFNVGTNYTAILARGACGGFMSGFMTFMSIGGFQSFIEEMKVFCRERRNGHYGVGVYVLSNFLSSLPFLTFMSTATTTITYFMVKFHPGASHFVYICLDLLASIAVVESCMMMIASLVPNFMMGVVIGSGYIGLMMMSSGYFRLFPDLPDIFWRYPVSYMNYGAWGLQGAYKNDMLGLEFESPIPGQPKMSGEVILRNILGMNPDYSKWWDLAMVVLILILYRLLFFGIIKFRERASPLLNSIYTKRTLHRLKKRASFRFPSKRSSFRNMSLFPSKRLEVAPSLASQEGFSSPAQ